MTEAHSLTPKTPIALFTYNRPEHTRRVLTSLSQCTRLEECDLYIYCDGPRRPDHQAAVRASRSVVREWVARRDARVIERSHNLGLARSVVTGVTELCAQYGRVIVLEDDLVVSPDFLDYMLQALKRYQDKPQVYQISGFLFTVECRPQSDVFFLPLTTTWGWATWERAWQAFDWYDEAIPGRLADPAFRRRFDLDGSYPFSDMLEHQLAGRVDSWGILWWYTVFSQGGLVLYPRQSLTQHLGVDGSGKHSGRADVFRQSAFDVTQTRLPQPLMFPSQIEVDEDIFNRVKVFLRTARSNAPLFQRFPFLRLARNRAREWLKADE
jgi:hypothetical protein